MSSSNVSDALIYGTIATAVVSLLSLSGACILPLVRGAARQRWMQFFIAMAVSTLSSDALLHIIPEVMGVHNHHHEHEHSENSTRTKRHTEDEGLSEDRQRLLWISAVLLVVYCVYFFEFIVFYRKRHTHHPEKIGHCPAHDEQRIESGKSMNNNSNCSNSDSETEDEEVWCGLSSRATVILFGDAVHNFVDGIAMGASFMSSWEQGLAATIAIVFHELPHELGDLAVLVDSGLPMCRALLLNLVSALTAFAGLYTSVAIGREGDTYQRVLLVLTAGMFLYVAWIDMLNHLKHDSPPDDPWLLVCGLQLAGFIVGFALVFAIGWYEEDITNWKIN